MRTCVCATHGMSFRLSGFNFNDGSLFLFYYKRNYHRVEFLAGLLKRDSFVASDSVGSAQSLKNYA